MKIAVLGATSIVGLTICKELAKDNEFFLVGRNAKTLEAACTECRLAGAVSAVAIEADLLSNSDSIISQLSNGRVDIFVNASSALSRLYDDDLSAQEFSDYAQVEILRPVEIVLALSDQAMRESRDLTVVFISTTLAVVSSPNRIVYGTMKRLHEVVLRELRADDPCMRMIIVRIGTRISREKETAIARGIGRTVFRAVSRGRSGVYTYGLAGRILVTAFWVQPIICRLMVYLSRSIGRAKRTS